MPFTKVVNIGGEGLRREVEENNSVLDILSLRCLGTVQAVMSSGQMDTYWSGAWKGSINWRHGFEFVIKLIVEATGVCEVI